MTAERGHGRPDTDPGAVATDRTKVVTPTAANLAEFIARLRLDGLQARGATRLVTRAVIDWAEGLGWMPVTEMPLAFLMDTDEAPGRQGIVDLFIARPSYKTDVVIEIDRTNKGWSAAKLGHAAAHGMSAIWVRWSGRGPLDDLVPAGVEVIRLSLNRAPEAHGATGPDLRVVPQGQGLSGASRVLLAALFPAGPPSEDSGWNDEATIWDIVGDLEPRRALIIRCRFGHFERRALTLARTAEVVADLLEMDVVSRERIRQVQNQALRQLRARARSRVRRAAKERGEAAVGGSAARPSLAPPTAGPRIPSTVADQRTNGVSRALPGNPDAAVEVSALRALLLDIVAKCEPDGVSATMIAHVLRGSSGPATQALVTRHNLPHHGALPKVPYRRLRDAITVCAAEYPFRFTGTGIRMVKLKRSASGR